MKHFYLVLITMVLSGVQAVQAQSVGEPYASKNKSQEYQVIKVYPNPASDHFSLTIPASELNYISINNIIGKEVRKVKANSSNFYDISDLKRGIYIVRIFNKSDELIKALRLSKA